MMSRPANRLELMSGMLKLDKDQKKQLKGIMDDGQKEAAPVKEEMLKARTAIADAVAAGKKGDDLKASLDAYAAAEAKMHQIELGAFAKIYQLLEKDQQAKAGPIFGMMAGVFKGKNWTEMN
jgi:Spy/CpxP family protein refolding chaperone